MSYRIVVATDFSEPSSYALRYALTILGRIPGSALHTVHVVVDTASHPNVGKDERLLGDALERLQANVRAIAEAAAENGERVEREVVHHVRLGKNAARGIEQVALDAGAELVVVGTHHRKGIDRLVLGSVAEDLLRSGRVALLIARPNAFEGMDRTPKLEPASPGADLHAARADMLESSERLAWRGRSSHIAGLV
jgi:nucleotide-binding universal stress UspA family protein